MDVFTKYHIGNITVSLSQPHSTQLEMEEEQVYETYLCRCYMNTQLLTNFVC